MDAISHCLQHVAADGDICFSIGEDTVQVIDKLDIVWKWIAAQQAVEQAFIHGIVKNSFLAQKGGFCGQPYLHGSSSSHPLMVLCTRSGLVVLVKKNNFLGSKIVGQSSAETYSQISCSPGN